MALMPDKNLFLKLFESIYASRELDILEEDFTKRGEAFFHVSGSGHENVAMLAPHLISDDYLHCHYRDKSLMLARGLPVKEFFMSLFCKDGSHSRGRQMSAHLSDPSRHILSLTGPVGNNALQAVGVASIIKNKPSKPLVYCAMGDGTTQEGEVIEAIGHAVRDSLPVLFTVEDNAFAISTKTPGRTFFDQPDGPANEFYGVPITRVDGRDPVATYQIFESLVKTIRDNRKPQILIFKVDRLNSHTNADDHRVYRTPEEIDAIRNSGDPVKILESWLQKQGVTADELATLKNRIKESVHKDAYEAQDSEDPQPSFTAKADLPPHMTDSAQEYRGQANGDQLVMLEAIRDVLKARMAKDQRVTLFGEDVEDPKGDVFGVTKGLSISYPGRVVNSPLSESCILGVSVGQALAGGRPVAFLQFADFFPIAYNQIFAELASMHWRTDGGWKCPVIVMVTTGAYKPGLGPFHASSMESIAAHTPGLDVYLPSSAGDAAGLLNAAFESERPSIFFYPKSCLNDRNATTSKDVARQFVPIGKARLHRQGNDFTFVGWGNTLGLCDKAAVELEKLGYTSDVIDLRSIHPWDEEMILASAKKTGRLIIAQEDSHSVSVASEISATIGEKSNGTVEIRRVSRPDTFVPFHFGNQLDVLPSYKKLLETAVDMLGGSVTWIKENKEEAGIFLVEAVGSSPSDESVTVIDWKVKVGDTIKKGMLLAEMEADKAAFELSCPTEGTLLEILVPVGDMVKVGTPLLKVSTGTNKVSKKQLTMENPGRPEVKLPTVKITKPQGTSERKTASEGVAGIASVIVAGGSRIVSNQEISEKCPDWTPDEIFKRIGIESRHWASENEDAVSLAVKAASALLEQQKLSITEIDAIYLATGTPISITPSTACHVLDRLSKGLPERPLVQAQDVLAACSGYLYALQAAWDMAHFKPDARILVITTEVLSRRTDHADHSTAPVFGDAATATLVLGSNYQGQWKYMVERPVLKAMGEDGTSLAVPLELEKKIHMDGPKIYVEAVKNMLLLLEMACVQGGVKVQELDLVVAHQANQRILNAVRQRAKLPEEKVFSNIRTWGNTSSSTLPICLADLQGNLKSGQTWGLVAFGGGYTFGGAIIKTV